MNAAAKICRSCRQVKPVEEFGVVKQNEDGRRYACKECYNGIRSLYRERCGDKIGAYKKSLYYANHDEMKRRLRERYPKVRAWKLMREYGMTVEQYDDMVTAQGGTCAICKQPPTAANGHTKKPSLHVDHDHETGRVRGLLCNSCNVAIGAFHDDTARMQEAIAYLEKGGI